MSQTYRYKLQCQCGTLIHTDPIKPSALNHGWVYFRCSSCVRTLKLRLGDDGTIRGSGGSLRFAAPLDSLESAMKEVADSKKSAFEEATPEGGTLNTAGAKADAGKPLPWLVLSEFSHALGAVVHIGTVGARKYVPRGWTQVEGGEERYMEAFGRHMLALGRGEKIDDGPGGTGGLHKAQMIWNLLASLELELRRDASWINTGKPTDPT